VAGCVHRVHWVQVGAWSRDACRQIRLRASLLHAPTCTQCTRYTQPATDRPASDTARTPALPSDHKLLARADSQDAHWDRRSIAGLRVDRDRPRRAPEGARLAERSLDREEAVALRAVDCREEDPRRVV